MKWFGIIKAIPSTWKKVIKNEVVDLQVGMPSACDIKIRGSLTSICKMSAKNVYNLLLKPILKKPASQNTILNMLNLSEIDWEKVYLIPLKVTIETSLRVFQYKILNNILYLNNRLYKSGFADNPLCSLCTKEPETIKHLFCYCIYTQKLWKLLRRWLGASVVLPALTAEAAIIGKWDAEHSNSLLVNHVTLLFKRFLYINRTTSVKLNLYSLKLYLRYIEIIEKRIAKEKAVWSVILRNGMQSYIYFNILFSIVCYHNLLHAGGVG